MLSVKKVKIRRVSEIIFRGYLNATYFFAILIRISWVELTTVALAVKAHFGWAFEYINVTKRMLQTKEVMICTCMFALRMEVSDNVHLGLQIHLFLQSFWMIVDSSLGYCTVNGLISPGRAPLTSGWKSHLWIKGNLQPANSIWICFRSLSISLSVIIFALFSCTSWLHWSKRCRRPIYVLHAMSVFLTGWDR